MRGQNQFRMRTQRRVLLQGFGHEGIQRRTGQMALVEYADQRVFIHQSAASGIDQIGAFAHLAHLRLTDDVGGFLGTWNMQGDDVSPGQQLIERLHRHAHAAGSRSRQERIIRGHFHADAGGFARHRCPDTAQADDAQAFAFQFEAGQAVFRPFAGLHSGIGFRHVPCHRKQQGDRMLGGGQGIAIRGIHDRDAARGGSLDINGIDTGTGTADDFQMRCFFQGFGTDQRCRAHHDAVEFFEFLRQHGRIFDGITGFNGETGFFEQGQAIGMDAVTSEDFHGSSKGVDSRRKIARQNPMRGVGRRITMYTGYGGHIMQPQRPGDGASYAWESCTNSTLD